VGRRAALSASKGKGEKFSKKGGNKFQKKQRLQAVKYKKTTSKGEKSSKVKRLRALFIRSLPPPGVAKFPIKKEGDSRRRNQKPVWGWDKD